MPVLERRIYILIAAIVLSFTPIIVIVFFSLQRIVGEERDLIAMNSSQLFAVEKLRYLNSSQSAMMPVYVLSGEDRVLENFEQHSRDFHKTISELSDSDSDTQYKLNLQGISDLSKHLKTLAAKGVQLRKNGASIKDVNEYFIKNTTAFSTELQKKLQDLSTKEEKDLSDAKVHFAKTVDWVLFTLLFFFVTSLILVIFISRLVVKTMRQQAALFKKEQELSQARKEAVETVAHDLKNPLSTIKMSMELMQQEEMTSEMGMGILQRSSSIMEKLINNVLDHAKIESGHLSLEKEECHLDQIVKELEGRFQPLADQNDIRLASYISPGNWTAYCDCARIEQVLSNILGNALKFTPSGGEIRIELNSNTEGFLISVQDTGPGIDPGLKKKIFERHWQVKKTARLGNGLGLSIAKSIMDAHKGKIWVESEKNQGAKFIVLIPRHQLGAESYPPGSFDSTV